MPMNIARESSMGKTDSLIAVTPPSSDEYVSQSRLTAATSSGRVTDQKPFSCGNWRYLRGPVHRAVRTQLLEQLVRRAVQPPIAVEDTDVVQGGGMGSHTGKLPQS